ncbi:hypothetical protein EYF80_046375 [Liparis tanakae]|uniref:Uncharacterized protein n=1 Tax=Liparis tanakae TaxID=230148 RepID=A0A4Z2FQC5_9TELE|nr:hypothetical protein EYF80_046375 [Liparis tanakae]
MSRGSEPLKRTPEGKQRFFSWFIQIITSQRPGGFRAVNLILGKRRRWKPLRRPPPAAHEPPGLCGRVVGARRGSVPSATEPHRPENYPRYQ